jgi:heterodisulfide reductase subunit B
MSQNKPDKYRRVAYYPGCALEGTGHAYNRSTRQVGKALGLDLVEVSNWNCCGAMEVKNIDPKIQTYLSSRVMAIASEEMGMHALDWIKHSIGEEGLRERVRGGLKGLRVANYYGCMYTRPRHIFPEKDAGPGSESTAKPHYMDDLLAAAGAVNVEFPLKTACCGGAHTLSDSDMSTKLVLNILRAAETAGAEVIATECPTCHSGLEMHQVRAEKRLGVKTSVKIIYFTQLLGLALGLSPRKVGLHENVSDASAVLAARGVT